MVHQGGGGGCRKVQKLVHLVYERPLSNEEKHSNLKNDTFTMKNCQDYNNEMFRLFFEQIVSNKIGYHWYFKFHPFTFQVSLGHKNITLIYVYVPFK